MSYDLTQIQNTLNSTNRLVGSQRSPGMFNDLISQQTVSLTSKLGTQVNGVVGGVLSLTQEVDNVVGAPPEQVATGLPIVQLTSDLYGLTDKLVVPLNTTNQTNMTAITGSTTSVAPAMLDLVVSAGTPTAVAAATAAAVPTATADQLLAVANQIQSPLTGELQNLDATLENALSPIVEGISSFTSTLTGLTSALDSITTALNRVGISSNITSALTTSLAKFQSSITDPILNSLSTVTSLPQITESGIFNSSSGIVPREVGATTGEQMTYQAVHTVEELEYDLRSTTREITELVVHWTRTSSDQYLTGQQLANITGETNYHYFINKDGSITRGISLETEGGLLNNSHHKKSIQIAFIGGLITTQTDAADQISTSASITPEQSKTFKVFVNSALLVWPGLQVLGHNSIDRAQNDPGFGVEDMIRIVFGKENVFNDPLNQPPFSRYDLINMKLPSIQTGPQ